MKDHSITFVGHSTLFINIKGFKILTDPIWARWFFLIPRIRKAGIDIRILEDEVDLILISHAHSDHLNKKTLKKMPCETQVATHTKNRRYVEKSKLYNISGFDYWQKKEFSNGNVKITLVPASHSKTCPWSPLGKPGGFVIESSECNIYFAGDTSFDENIFKEVAKKFKIDFLLMPIGSYSPRWLLKNQHTSPEEALKALEIIGAKKMIPIHWGSFLLSFYETPQTPIKNLKRRIAGTSLEDKVMILKNGETFSF
jgi:L-ascorbate metabolism protein UlaG (beta-lactamase superfamily)